MKKNKLIALSAAAILSATAVIGGTMAYFTDTEEATNTFTVGEVKIDLDESNGEGAVDDAYQEWLKDQTLIPTTDAQKENTIAKIVTIKNTGVNDAYLWAEAWIPSELDNENASKNSLHFNFGKDTGVAYKLITDDMKTMEGYTGYILYSADPVAKGDATPELMTQVYMDAKVTQCEDETHADTCYVLADGTTHYDGSWEIKINAIGIQADSFDNIDAAMDAYYAK